MRNGKPRRSWHRDLELFNGIAAGQTIPVDDPVKRVPRVPAHASITAKLAKINNDFDAEIEAMRHNSPF